MASAAHRSNVICKGCKNDQEKKGYKPRQLLQMPFKIVNHPAFKKRGATPPLMLCEHCDGDATERCIVEHDVERD